MTDPYKITPAIGIIMMETIFKFLQSDKGSANFAEFVNQNLPNDMQASASVIKGNSENLYVWWCLTTDAMFNTN